MKWSAKYSTILCSLEGATGHGTMFELKACPEDVEPHEWVTHALVEITERFLADKSASTKLEYIFGNANPFVRFYPKASNCQTELSVRHPDLHALAKDFIESSFPLSSRLVFTFQIVE